MILGGPLVYDHQRQHFAVQIGLNRVKGAWDLRLESPGNTHKVVPLGDWDAARIHLKLECLDGTYSGYYRMDSQEEWKLVGSVNNDELAGGVPLDARAGVLTKSYGGDQATVEYRMLEVTPLTEESE